MKSFQQFQEDLSKNVIRLDKESQKNLNKAKKGQIGPGSKPVPHTQFKLEPLNIPMK
ncbi:hypothetical protein PQC13_gp219 [Synechococcus phage S-SRM01]|uniref:Uncharacterized protein n=1 Tax=Synechococcus phage S-SRM01 TaxID=2781608 RepID=A0A879R1X1_9CAUD|nr:hypothetical protein PQC13_gp219 [Synechococcus phage S-SRM01]QPX48184.1 hypothetical protein [Synechococcus phage S-SRM01]